MLPSWSASSVGASPKLRNRTGLPRELTQRCNHGSTQSSVPRPPVLGRRRRRRCLRGDRTTAPASAAFVENTHPNWAKQATRVGPNPNPTKEKIRLSSKAFESHTARVDPRVRHSVTVLELRGRPNASPSAPYP